MAPVASADQFISNGMKRIFATQNASLDIDGVDDYRVDVDVAVLDSGIDLDHPDLNVVEGIDCTEAVAPIYACDTTSPGVGNDSHGHGTAAAGTIGAIDNGYGVVGVAPGARLWSVDVLDDQTFAQVPATSSYDGLVAGVKWVTEHADEIEVAKMIGGCTPLTPPPSPTQATCPSDDEGQALEDAIDDAIDAGVVFVGGMGQPDSIPGSYDDFLAVSPIADFDGLPGSLVSSPVCQGVPDTFNVGEVDDSTSGSPTPGTTTAARILAPGYCIATTTHTGGYAYGAPGSAPSSASPHVAGAAALLASADNPDSRSDAESVVDTLIETGNQNWIDEMHPGDPRPLLDVGDETEFSPHTVPGADPDAESDVDGDGHADLVALSPDGGAYTYRGDGASKFDGSPVVESLRVGGVGMVNPAQFDGSGLFMVDVADVTGDRRDDLVALSSAGKAVVAPGLASGEFSQSFVQSLSGLTPGLLVAGGFESIAVADVSGDGRADFVAYDDVADKVMVYLGNASGSFTSPGVEAAAGVSSALHTASGEYFVDAADVTGDRRADLVSMRTSDDSIVVRAGVAGGTFAAPVASQVGSVDTALDDGAGFEPAGLGDVTGDGRADLVLLKDRHSYTYAAGSGGALGAPVVSFESIPAGGNMPSSAFGSSGFEVAGVLDVNGDGRADLVYVGPGGNGNVAVGLASGNFGPNYGSFGGTFRSTQHFRNQDSTGREIVIEKPAVRRRGCQAIGCVASDAESDVDGDGHADLVALSPDGGAYTYRGDGASKFDGSPVVESLRVGGVGMVNPAQFDGSGLFMVDVADVTGDRRDDLVALSSAGKAVVAPGLASGGFSQSFVQSLSGLTPGLLVAGGFESIAVADVSGDGRADFVAYDDVADKVMVYLGNASGSFTSPGVEAAAGVSSALHTASGEYFVDAADVTGDRRADLVSMRTSDDSILMRAGNANGTFAAPVASLVGSVDTALDDAAGFEPAGLGDVNGDGRSDLVMLKDRLSHTYLAQSGGTFGSALTSFEAPPPVNGNMPSSAFGSSGFEVAGVLDVNRDGRADLVYVGPGGNGNVAVGLASGNFGPNYGSFGGTFRSTQHFRNQDSTGREIVIEKPAVRRAGCSATGC